MSTNTIDKDFDNAVGAIECYTGRHIEALGFLEQIQTRLEAHMEKASMQDVAWAEAGDLQQVLDHLKIAFGAIR